MKMLSRPLWLALVLWAGAAAAEGDPALPRRQSGLWQTSVDGVPTGMGQCVDRGRDDVVTPLLASEPAKAQCSRSAPRRESGDRLVLESVCETTGRRKTVRIVFSGDFEREVSAELVTSFDPPRPGRAPRSHRMDMRRVGACPPGVQHGQMVMAPVR